MPARQDWRLIDQAPPPSEARRHRQQYRRCPPETTTAERQYIQHIHYDLLILRHCIAAIFSYSAKGASLTPIFVTQPAAEVKHRGSRRQGGCKIGASSAPFSAIFHANGTNRTLGATRSNAAMLQALLSAGQMPRSIASFYRDIVVKREYAENRDSRSSSPS